MGPEGRVETLARRARAFDVTVAVLLVALSLLIFVPMVDRSDADVGVVAGVALLVVHGGCIAWRRRAPLAVIAVNLVSGVAFCALGFPVVALGVAVLVALYTVASLTRREHSLAALGAAILAMAAIILSQSPNGDKTTVLGNVAVLGVTWFLGESQRARRVYVAQLEQRTAELESARDELARSAVAEERLRIARELHDVVAHSMGMIAVQAGVGAHVIDTRPADAKRSLEVIEGASKSALGELRRMLGLLRSTDEQTDTAPSPGLEGVPRLVEEVRGAGLDVELSLDPPPRPVAAGVGLTIYRIVQEALTNVVRHAGARRARVAVWFAQDRARVEVTDDGSGGPAAPEGGHGIPGMRERVSMHGGTLDARPLAEGGFIVSATIPLEREET